MVKILNEEYKIGTKTLSDLIKEEENLLYSKVESFNSKKDFLISYFELRTPNGIAISSLGQIKQNIVKFPPSQPPLLPTQELTFDESAENYKALQVRIYLWTEDNIAVAEPLVFPVKEDTAPIDVVNPSDNRIKRDDWLGKATGIFGGLLGLSLLISGSQKA